jgi:hypothetical protein
MIPMRKLFRPKLGESEDPKKEAAQIGFRQSWDP